MKKIKSFFSYMGKMVNSHPLIFCAILSVLETFIIESMSRHSVIKCVKYILESPTVFLYNCLIILFTLSISLLFKRRVFGIVLLSAPWLLCGLINSVVLSYRVTPLGAIDFQIVKLSLILVYLTKAQRILVYVLSAVLVVAIVALWIIGPKISGKVNYGKNVASIVGMLLCLVIATNLALNFNAISNNFGNIAGAYNDYGFAYCFSSGIIDTGIDKPANYNEEALKEITSTFEGTKKNNSRIKPDIILVQLESFVDAKTIKDLTFSDDPAPIHTYLKENFTSGRLKVPSLGGGTANTEFEVLTGINLDFFGAGEYPYKTIMLKETVESLPFNLKENGYSAHAIHNHTGNFYDRDKVYPNMGFDTFQSKEYMYDYEVTPYGWCKDKALTAEIMDALNYVDEEKGITEENPRFVWTVSVQGHGAYPTEPIKDADNVIKIESDKFSEEELCALGYYINQIWEEDMFLGSLISAVENRDKPTLIVAYGDHLPSIGLEDDMLTTGDLYSTEYVTWNNFGLPKEEGKELFSYELSSYIMDMIGMNNGYVTKLHQKKLNMGEEFDFEEYQDNLKFFAYDMLYGKNLLFGGEKPYMKTPMQMGTTPIEIENIKVMGNSLYVQGEGFTDKSKIFINGEKCKSTVMLSRFSLMTSDVEIKDGDVITVGQASSKREVLSYSNAITFDTLVHSILEEQ